MKIERQRLTQAINIANMVIERRNAIPILGNVAILPGLEAVTIVGTDLDMEVAIEIDAISSAGDAVTIPAPHRIGCVLNLGGAEVEIERVIEDKETTRLAIRSGRLDLEVRDLPYEDFPRLASSGLAASEARLSTAHIDTILRVAHACSTEETRYYLNGVYIHAASEDDWSLRAVATDGHRLYHAPLALPDSGGMRNAMPENGSQRGIIVPRKVIRLLAQLRKRMDGEIRFGLQPSVAQNSDKTLAPQPAGTRAIFAFETKDRQCKVTIATKIIDGTFPDYSRVIPSDNQDKQIEIDRAALRKAVELIAATSGERTRAIKLTFDPAGEGRLRVSAQHVDEIVKASTWIPANTSVTEPFSIGFNGAYLADICAVSEGDNLVIETMDAGAPSKIASPSSDGFRTVLMPMRV